MSSCIFSFFYDEQDNCDIHQSLSSCCLRNELRVFRVISWVLLTIIYLWQVVLSKSLFVQIEYLTLHGLFLAWLYFGLITIDKQLSKSRSGESCRLKYWIELIYETSLCLEVLISLIYWCFLFAYDLKHRKKSVLLLFILQHSLPIILLLIDFANNTIRFKPARLILIAAYGCLYLVINIGYTLVAKPIYPILPWNNVLSVILAVGSIILVIVTFVVFRYLTVRCKGQIGAPERQGTSLVGEQKDK